MSEILRSRTRRNAVVAGTIVLIVAAGLTLAFFYTKVRSDREMAKLEQLNEKLRNDRQLSNNLNQELKRRIHETNVAVEAQDLLRASQKEALETEKARLLERIHRLEEEGKESAGRIQTLRDQLENTSSKLELYNPVNVEERKLRKVGLVLEAIVLVEATLQYHEQTTGELLFVETDALGNMVANLEGEGEPYEKEATGSGFCVAREGWILTNGHVARPPGYDVELSIEGDSGTITLVPEFKLDVVFSGESERHVARVERAIFDEENDVALLKIEPFENIPFLDDFDVGGEPPEPLSEIYLFGFPLGKAAPQEGETVIASTFKGIFSRPVGMYLQVDAGVLPGNSGGPVTDSKGRVIGIVTRVQVDPEEGIVSNMGFVLPIQKAGAVWPPK